MANTAAILDMSLSGDLSSLSDALADGTPHPTDLALATALGEAETVKCLIAADPALATEPTGPHDWPPAQRQTRAP